MGPWVNASLSMTLQLYLEVQIATRATLGLQQSNRFERERTGLIKVTFYLYNESDAELFS